jgi:glycosyltransferase involved in cell wall biosynthesis
MRIVHVANNSEMGALGIDGQVVDLAVAQKSRGSKVMLLIDHPGVFADACHEHGIPLIAMEGLKPDGGSLMQPPEKVVQNLADQFTDFGADLIHCHTVPAASQAIPAGNRIDIPCVFTCDSTQPVMAAKRVGIRFATICMSKASFEELRSNGVPEADIYYVPIGTRALPTSYLPEMLPSQPPCLIFAGSLSRGNGVDVAILAMAELQRRRGQACPVLNIYGRGDQEKHLREMTDVLGLNEVVRFHGIRPGILDQRLITGILIMSSRWEIDSLVVLEAMSRGMPIAATHVGGVAEMLPDRRYGRVVPPDSIVELADAVESLLSDIADGQFNPSLLVERHRSLYSNEKMAERIDAVYSQVLVNVFTAGEQPAGSFE